LFQPLIRLTKSSGFGLKGGRMGNSMCEYQLSTEKNNGESKKKKSLQEKGLEVKLSDVALADFQFFGEFSAERDDDETTCEETFTEACDYPKFDASNLTQEASLDAQKYGTSTNISPFDAQTFDAPTFEVPVFHIPSLPDKNGGEELGKTTSMNKETTAEKPKPNLEELAFGMSFLETLVR